MAFRNRMFEFCNLLKDSELRHEISKTIKSISKTKDDGDIYQSTIPMALGSQRLQFFGYLLIDEKIDEEIKQEQIFKNIKHLTAEERNIMEIGHMLILSFIDKALEDIKNFSKTIARVIHPYYGYDKLRFFDKNIKDIPIKESDLEKYTRSFRMSSLSRAIKSSQEWNFIKELSEDELYGLLEVIKRDINKVAFKDVPEFLREFSLKKFSGQGDSTQLMMEQILTLFAIRETIELAIQMIFTTLCGKDLIVFDNDNIITIDEDFSNTMTEGLTIFSVDSIMGLDRIVGNLALVTCSQGEDFKIKKFGRIDEVKVNFLHEEGDTLKCKIRVIDENLNPYFNLMR